MPKLYDRALSDDMTMGRAVHEGDYRFVRRRALLLRFARTAALRLQGAADPEAETEPA